MHRSVLNIDSTTKSTCNSGPFQDRTLSTLYHEDMPSYADEYAARHSRSNNAHEGPVRIVMSRGDSRRDATGRIEYNEKWDQEVGMDIETFSSGDEDHQKAHLTIQRVPSRSPSPSMGEILSVARRSSSQWRGGCTLLVLDTLVLPCYLSYSVRY